MYIACTMSSLIHISITIDRHSQSCNGCIVMHLMVNDQLPPGVQEHNVKRTQMAKYFLSKQHYGDRKLIDEVKQVLDEALNDCDKVLHNINTTHIEGSHQQRTRFARKDRFFPASYKARSMLSAMHENMTDIKISKLVLEKFDTIPSPQMKLNLGKFHDERKILSTLKKTTASKIRSSKRRHSKHKFHAKERSGEYQYKPEEQQHKRGRYT